MNCQKYVLPLIIVIISIVTFYVYTLTFCGYEAYSATTFTLLVVHDILYILTIWSLLETTFIKPALVPQKYKLTNEENEQFDSIHRSEDRNRFLLGIMKKRRIVLDTRSNLGLIR